MGFPYDDEFYKWIFEKYNMNSIDYVGLPEDESIAIYEDFLEERQ